MPTPEGRRPAELDDLTLRRAQQGEDAACRALVARYQRPVFAVLGRMLGRAGHVGLVEDLAQETFLRAFKALPGFDSAGPARLSTWLITIATHLALDELRRKPLRLVPIEAATRAAADVHADDDAVRRRLAAAITRAVEALTPEYRAPFILREFHEMECMEIARVLAIGPDTVRSRLARARAALRAALAEVAP